MSGILAVKSPAVLLVSSCVRNSYGVRILAVGLFGLVVRNSDNLDASDRVRCQRSEQPTGLGRHGLVRDVDDQECDVYIGALVPE